MTRLIIDGNAVYEIDEECLTEQKKNRSKGRVRVQEHDKTAAAKHGKNQQ